MAEQILVNYKHDITYNNTALNAIGATKSTTLRTVDAHDNTDTKYVRKFGAKFFITDITNLVINTPRSDGGGVNKWWYEYYDFDTDTLLGTVKDENGVSTFINGSTVVSNTGGIYLKIVHKAGTVSTTNGDIIIISSNLYPGGRNSRISAESFAGGEMLLAQSLSGNTYYMEDTNDDSMKYGGYRDFEVGVVTRPFRTIQDAIDDVVADGAPFDKVVVLDSETYDEDIDIPSTMSVLAELGETPTITNGIGARITREVSTQYNNTIARYFNENGDDVSGDGSWQNPYLTIGVAYTDKASLKALVYGGIGASGSGIFTEFVTTGAGVGWKFTLEADYGYIPTLKWDTGTICINCGPQVGNPSLYGFIMDGLNIATYGIYLGNSATIQIKDTTFINFLGSSFQPYTGSAIRKGPSGAYTLTVEKCLIENSGNGIVIEQISGTNNIKKNIFNNVVDGIIFYPTLATTLTISIEDNLFYNTLIVGIGFFPNGAFTLDINGDINNNIFIDGTWGIKLDAVGGATNDVAGLSIENNIFKDINITGGHGVFSDVAITIDFNCFFNNETNYNVNVTSNNEILSNPDFCSDSLPFEFGLSSESPCYRAGSTGDDIGARLRIIEINNDDIILNGFNIDGQEQYNNGIYILDTADHIGFNLKWCSIFDFQGIAVDLYDDDTDLNAQILNCEIYNSGNGIKLNYGGNTIEENLIYSNTIFGIYIDQTMHTFNHNIFWNNQYGLYIESNSGGLLIKNCIFNLNSLYGIYSEISIMVTYCCITDALNNVDNSDSSNITNNPLFVNTNFGSENFHIKTIEAGYQKDSACKDSADDGYDIGAYLVDRSVDEDYWQKYPFEFNPHVQWTNIQEGYSQFVDALAGKDNFAKDSKRIFVFDFGHDQQVSSEEIRQKMEYFATLIKTRANGLVEEQTKFRLHFQPTSYLVAKASAVITTADNNIFDSTKDLVENQFKGFHLGVLYTSGIATGTIDPVGKTLTIAPDPGWTNDEHIGFSFPYNGYYYYILDNDSDSLTLSDPNETLTVQAGIDWTIEKYFKIISNSENTYCVSDDDDELVDGTYTYYIDFIECKVFTSSFQYLQPRFLYTREHSKTGYKLIFQEV